MLKRELLRRAQVPDGEELELYSHGDDFMIVCNRNELMNTRMQFSEEQLSDLTMDRLDTEEPHLLIGGYGMGFTLRAALARMGPKGIATVVELVPEIIDWAKGPMKEFEAGCLDDPRVHLVMGDVAGPIENAARRGGVYDAILLDVDNGPDGFAREENNRLYGIRMLDMARHALRPGGVLSIWSAAPDPQFTRRLQKAGFDVEQREVRARPNNKGGRHTIWFARQR